MAFKKILSPGSTYGRLTITGLASSNCSGASRYYYHCDCGNEGVALRGNIVSGNTRSCGCYWSSLLKGRTGISHPSFKHGLSKTVEHNVWNGMIIRCTNQKHRDYADYGGRGIKVCDRWLADFTNFLRDMGHRPGVGYHLDRIDNNGSYEPTNCRWVTVKENQNNRRKRLRLRDFQPDPLPPGSLEWL